MLIILHLRQRDSLNQIEHVIIVDLAQFLLLGNDFLRFLCIRVSVEKVDSLEWFELLLCYFGLDVLVSD